MDMTKRTLMLIGVGTILGFALWGLASWDRMESIGWVAAGVVIVVCLWLAWAISERKGRRISPSAAQPTRAISLQTGTPELDHLRRELRAYGLTAFAAVGLFLAGLSLSEPEEPVSIRFLPDFLGRIRFADSVYVGLGSGFLVVAVAFMLGALMPWVAARFDAHRWSFQWMEISGGIIVLAGVSVGWTGNLPTVLNLPAVFVYVYFYGGFLVFLLTTALLVQDSHRAARNLKRASEANGSRQDASSPTANPA